MHFLRRTSDSSRWTQETVSTRKLSGATAAHIGVDPTSHHPPLPPTQSPSLRRDFKDLLRDSSDTHLQVRAESRCIDSPAITAIHYTVGHCSRVLTPNSFWRKHRSSATWPAFRIPFLGSEKKQLFLRLSISSDSSGRPLRKMSRTVNRFVFVAGCVVAMGLSVPAEAQWFPHATRTRKVCCISGRYDYSSNKLTSPVTSVTFPGVLDTDSATSTSVRSEWSTRTKVRIKSFPLRERVLANDHRRTSKVVVTVAENGMWSVECGPAKDKHGNQRIEIPPTVIIHRYYY